MCPDAWVFSECGEPYPERPDPERFLRSCPLIGELSEATIAKLIEGSHLAYAEHNVLLWSPSAPNRFFTIILTGILRLTRRSAKGKEMTVEILGSGSPADVYSNEAQPSCPLTAEAVTNLWYLKVPNQLWHQVLKEEPLLQKRLSQELTRRFLQALETTELFLVEEDERRLAGILVHVIKLNSPELSPRPQVTLISRPQLARLAGLPIEIVHRITAKWEAAGLITAGKGAIQVSDPLLLKRLTTQLRMDSSF